MNYQNSHKVVRLSELDSSLTTLHSPLEAVLCYGSFNIIHPGHIRYFRQARDHGDSLNVAIEGDHSFSKDLDRSKFREQARADALASVDIVDCIIILDTGNLLDLVKKWLPKALVLGNEFEGQRSKQISSVIEFLEDTNYYFTDYNIAVGNSSYWSFPTWPSHLDHILITNELFNNHDTTYTILSEHFFSGGWSEYEDVISDHRPVGIRLKMEN